MPVGPFDWILICCLGTTAVYLALDTAMRQSEPPIGLADRFPSFIRTPKWNYLPLTLMIIAGMMLVIRALGPAGQASLTPSDNSVVAPAAPTPVSMSAEATSPQLPRTKQAISDLLAESGQLQDLIEKAGVPLAEEWRRLLDRNPEEVCLDLDVMAYRDKIVVEREKFRVAYEAFDSIMKQNQIDEKELAPLIGGIGNYHGTGFLLGINSLDAFTRDFDLLRNLNTAGSPATRPSCELTIKSNKAPNMFIVMDRGLNQFNGWLTPSIEKIKKYRDDLRKELRNAH